MESADAEQRIRVLEAEVASLRGQLAAAALLAWTDASGWTETPLPSRAAAEIVDAARADGDRACVLPFVRGALMAYTRPPREIVRAARIAGCDIAIGSAADPRSLRRGVRARLGWVWELRGRTPLLVFSREPPNDVEPVAPSRRSATSSGWRGRSRVR